MAIGDFALLDSAGNVLAYERRNGAQRLIVALNLGTDPQRLELPGWASNGWPILSTIAEAMLVEDDPLLFRANEGLIREA